LKNRGSIEKNENITNWERNLIDPHVSMVEKPWLHWEW